MRKPQASFLFTSGFDEADEEKRKMKKMLCAATAAVTMAAAMMAGAVGVPTAEAKDDFVEFPFPYQGEWCALYDDSQTGIKWSITYVRRACDNPAGQVFIAADTYSERDSTCRMISAVGLNRAITNDAPFDARLRCSIRRLTPLSTPLNQSAQAATG
jgi:hypothetical protein